MSLLNISSPLLVCTLNFVTRSVSCSGVFQLTSHSRFEPYVHHLDKKGITLTIMTEAYQFRNTKSFNLTRQSLAYPFKRT